MTVILAPMRNVETVAPMGREPVKQAALQEYQGGAEGRVARSSEEGSVMELKRRGGLVQRDGDGKPDTGKSRRDLTTGSMFCPGREEPDETRVSRTVL